MIIYTYTYVCIYQGWAVTVHVVLPCGVSCGRLPCRAVLGGLAVQRVVFCVLAHVLAVLGHILPEFLCSGQC